MTFRCLDCQLLFDVPDADGFCPRCRSGLMWPHSSLEPSAEEPKKREKPIRRLITTVVAATALAAAPASAAVEKKPKWMTRFAWAVGICETGKGHRHPDFQHRGGQYEGFAGWYAGTWDLDKPKGAPDHAYQASPRQQYQAFLTGRARGRYWGCIVNGGYRSWM